MRGRIIITWVLLSCLVAGAAWVAGLAPSAEQATAGVRYEERHTSFRVSGHVGPNHQVWRQGFLVPADAAIVTRLRWRNDRARLGHQLREDGARVRPDDVTTAKTAVNETFRVDQAELTMVVIDHTTRIGTRFRGVVRIRWKEPVQPTPTPTPTSSPTPSPDPSGSPTSTPDPTPSPDPSPSPGPGPSPSPDPDPDPDPDRWAVQVLSVGTPATRVDEALAIPTVAGISMRIGWGAVEPSPGDYRWAKIDQTIAQARAAGKVAQIRVIAGIYSPDWVLQQVPTLRFSDRYLYNPANYPDTVTMPIPWTDAYLDRWDRFVAALGARYDGAAGLAAIHMSGGGFIGEMTLPTDVETWLAEGYTDSKLIGAWDRIIGSYRRAFARTPFTLGITEPFGSLLETDVVDPVVAEALRTGERAAWIQSNALRAAALGTIGPYRKVIRASNTVTTVGYQMIADAPTVSSLHDAFTVALQDGADYVEVYGSDVLDPVNRDELRYLASGGT